MALQKPVVNTFAAFDATKEQIIKFSVNSGDQVVANRAIIKLGSTNEIVYNSKQTTFALEHTIPEGTLTNGKYYIIQIETYNAEGSASALSSAITFYCYTTPNFYISNLPTNNVLSNAEYNFTLSYNQSQGEPLNSYSINIYDSSHNLVWTTSTIYTGSNGVPPTSFSATVNGFRDSSIYYIRALGQTDQLTILDTGYILLTTIFDATSIYTQFNLTNNQCDGYILIQSNIKSLDGTSSPTPPIYIDNKEIDLRGFEDYVNWENSFAIYDMSTTRIWLRDINPNSIIATFYNANNPDENITLSEREVQKDGKTYIYIEGTYTDKYNLTGYIFTEQIEKPTDNQQIMIWLQKEMGLYDISVALISV